MIVRLFLLLVLAHTSTAVADARLIIHLADYLANDYSGAVSEQGEVLSDVEYAEQVEFAQTALKEVKTDPKLKGEQELTEKVANLEKAIVSKKGPSVVVPLAREIQQDVIRVSGIALSPQRWPDYDRAKELFVQNCISCHGPEGRGDGPDGVDLDPSPANFHDMERAPIVSSFAAFNTIRLGVPGTGMLSFADFSDEDIWSLAYYVSTFRFGEPEKGSGALSDKITNTELLEKSASLNDAQLEEFVVSKGEDPELVRKVRLFHFQGQTPLYFDTAENLLNQSVEAFEAGDFKEAERLSFDAYFSGFEPVETKISANDSDAVTRIEEKMAAFRKAIKERNGDQVKTMRDDLVVEIRQLKELLGDDQLTPGIAFLSGFSIILREGFEAVLVILSILGVAKASGSALVGASIHLGWIISLVLGVIGWFLSGWLIAMSGMSREIMEATAAFMAVFVLLYVGFWMHRQTEINRWREFIEVKVKNLTHTKNLVGLFMLSFVVTFREVFETVLFLRAIYNEDTTTSGTWLAGGVLSAFAVVISVSVLITKFRNRISLQKFFTLSSVLMMGLAAILAGKGVHALHEAGLISLSALPVKIRVELLGIFPTWESVIAQVLVLVSAFLIWKFATKKKVSPSV